MCWLNEGQTPPISQLVLQLFFTFDFLVEWISVCQAHTNEVNVNKLINN